MAEDIEKVKKILKKWREERYLHGDDWAARQIVEEIKPPTSAENALTSAPQVEEGLLSSARIDEIDEECGSHEIEQGKPNPPKYYEYRLLNEQRDLTMKECEPEIDKAYSKGLKAGMSLVKPKGYELAPYPPVKRKQ